MTKPTQIIGHPEKPAPKPAHVPEGGTASYFLVTAVVALLIAGVWRRKA